MLTQLFNKDIRVGHLILALTISALVAMFFYFTIKFITRRILMLISKHHMAKVIKRDISFLSLTTTLLMITSIGGNIFVYYYDLGQQFHTLLEKISTAFLLLICIAIIYFIVDLTIESFRLKPNLKKLALKSYSQLIKISVFVIFSLLAASFLFGKDPWAIITGIAAMTTLLTFMFKDSILGMVSSIQIAFNNSVKVGDWIEFKQYDANGNVVEITLTSVKIKNFDNTITRVPTYALMSESYRNWQAMIDSNARRIKRAISINVDTIQPVDDGTISALNKKGYHFDRQAFNSQPILTNLALYRYCIVQYLEQHPDLRAQSAKLVIELEPTANGLPIQVVAYCIYTDTQRFESVQANIIDYMIITLKDFDLQIFQNLSETVVPRE